MFLEIGKKEPLIIGKYYVGKDDELKPPFWVEAAENGLVKGINKRWVIHYHDSSGCSIMMTVLSDVLFALGESEFVITAEKILDTERILYYLERTA